MAASYWPSVGSAPLPYQPLSILQVKVKLCAQALEKTEKLKSGRGTHTTVEKTWGDDHDTRSSGAWKLPWCLLCFQRRLLRMRIFLLSPHSLQTSDGKLHNKQFTFSEIHCRVSLPRKLAQRAVTCTPLSGRHGIVQGGAMTFFSIIYSRLSIMWWWKSSIPALSNAVATNHMWQVWLRKWTSNLTWFS